MHIIGYNDCASRTKLEKIIKRGDLGIIRVDVVCKTYDNNYHNETINDKKKKADEQMLSELNQIKNPTVEEKLL